MTSAPRRAILTAASAPRARSTKRSLYLSMYLFAASMWASDGALSPFPNSSAVNRRNDET